MKRSPWVWFALGLVIIYARGLAIDLMDVDATQYASISMEMLQSGHWLQLFDHQHDYLDKPPLLFWSVALSFAVFGLHAWAYKLPSLLAAGAGVFAAYRFALLYYPRTTARNAAFILASSIGVILACNDVRTDALLMGMTACATWQLAVFLQPLPHGGRPTNAALAGLFVGLAMLAKGPIGLVAPAFAVATHLTLQRAWSRLLRWRAVIGVIVLALVLAPMCWGLYQQFDLHPEKVVDHQTGVSGLYFFFWQQSFGRITGASGWKNDTSPWYFVHVSLWAFLPWSFLFGGALWRRIGDAVRARRHPVEGDEAYSLGGFVLTFVALSLSHYKLPHYIFITLPWAAILTARWIGAPSRWADAIPRAWWWVQYVVFAALGAVLLWLLRGVFPTANIAIWSVVALLAGGLAWRCWLEPFPPAADRMVERSLAAALATAFVLNFHFYPNLLPYQSTTAAARYAKAQGIPASDLAFYNRGGNALDFTAGRVLPGYSTPDEVRARASSSGAYWLYTDSVGRARLDSAGVPYAEQVTFQHFQVSLLTLQFLNASTRSGALHPAYLLRIVPP